MDNLIVNFNEAKEGRNFGTVESFKRNEKFNTIFDMGMSLSNGVYENFRIYDDSKKTNGQVRKLIMATIYEEGIKKYSLTDIIGKQIIIDIKKEVSDKGNEYWKILNFEKVDSDTDLSEFEFCEQTETKQAENIKDIEDLLK